MKHLLVLLLTIGLIGCSSSDEQKPSKPVKPPPAEEPTPKPKGPLGYDSSYQKGFVKLNEQELPVGKCELLGEKKVWAKSVSHKDMRNCTSEKLGEACPRLRSYCKIDNLSALSCKSQKQYQCHGWVYEKSNVDGGRPEFKPLEGAKAYIFNFTGCTIGICEPQSEVVKSDKNGYYELKTSTLNSQLRVHKKESHYNACNMGSPFAFSGTRMIGDANPDRLSYPVALKKLDADSCK